MYYTIYKISNKISGKIYIGSHKTTNLDDGYMGSGKYLKHAQEKHGMENFEKEILFIFDTPEDMYDKEAELVNADFIAEENTYNIKVGGFGGWDYLNSTGLNNSSKTKEQLKRPGLIHSEKLKTDQKYHELHSKRHSERFTRLHHEGKFKYDMFTGKNHSDESKKKIGEKNSKNQSGNLNSQFGTVWITDGKNNKKIKKNDIIPEGWNTGRSFGGVV